MNGFLLVIAVKGTAILACCGLTVLAARRCSAATRHLIWAAGVCALLVLPCLSLLAPTWAPPLPQAVEAAETAARTVVNVTGETVRRGLNLPELLGVAWGAVSALLLLRLLVVQRRAVALSRGAESWRNVAGVEVKLSTYVDVPAVCGLARPAVCCCRSTRGSGPRTGWIWC